MLILKGDMQKHVSSCAHLGMYSHPEFLFFGGVIQAEGCRQFLECWPNTGVIIHDDGMP